MRRWGRVTHSSTVQGARISRSEREIGNPAPTRRQDRSAPFTIVRECGLTGHDGSAEFAHDRGGRTCELVTRVRFPSPTLGIVPGFIVIFGVGRCGVGGQTPRQPARAPGDKPKHACLAPTREGRGPTRSLFMAVHGDVAGHGHASQRRLPADSERDARYEITTRSDSQGNGSSTQRQLMASARIAGRALDHATRRRRPWAETKM